LYVILGPRATAIMGTRERPSAAGYVSGIGAVLLGLALYFWLRAALEAHGYDFQGRF
jgi:hypothetical protein